MKIHQALLALALLAATASSAQASTIDYIFSGQGAGTLGGAAFSGPFQITLIGDTSAIATTGPTSLREAVTGNFTTIAGAVNFGAGTSVSLDGNTIGFGQTAPAPTYFVAEALTSSAFSGYKLDTSFLSTNGTVSFGANQPFATSAGTLLFSNITSLAFGAQVTASVAAVPLPASFPMFCVALAGLGFMAHRRRTQS